MREANNGRLNLEEILPYSKADLLDWAPVTRKHLAKGGLSIATLAQAAQEMSDGVAANLFRCMIESEAEEIDQLHRNFYATYKERGKNLRA
ncbi:MAG TPA: hypothetical protein VL987_04945 [Cellvibrio sp.]|nr:hypothetical protein [Cellvibrio sp.]